MKGDIEMIPSRNITIFTLALLFVFSTSAFAADFHIEVTSDKELYCIDDTAFFTVTVYKNGELLTGNHTLVEATFPDEEHPVALNQVSEGVYSYESELTSDGQMTLTAFVRYDFPRVIEAMEAMIFRLENQIAELEERLAGETRPWKRRVLETMIHNRLTMIDKLEEKIANFEEPKAVGMKTITVTDDLYSPEFGERWPAQSNSNTWVGDANQEIGVKVSDSDSGISTVLIYVDNAAEPIEMNYDGVHATYTPTDAWVEGLHDVKIIAIDDVGHEATMTFSFIVDLHAPVFTSFSPETTHDTMPLISVGVSDALGGLDPSSIVLRLDSSPPLQVVYQDGTIQYQVESHLVLGDYYVFVSVSDYTGNEATATYIFSIIQ